MNAARCRAVGRVALLWPCVFRASLADALKDFGHDALLRETGEEARYRALQRDDAPAHRHHEGLLLTPPQAPG